MTGRFLTFEGNDGAGKTTQIRRLAAHLTALGYDILLTREPGGSPGAEDIRNLVLQGDPDRWSSTTELLLFMAARRDHVEKVIQPALKAGKIVLCDRYVGSTLALQCAGGVDPQFIIEAHDRFIGLWPDATLFLELSPDVALARGLARGTAEERFEQKGNAYHQQVAHFYTWQLQTYDWWHRVDADGDEDTVAQRVQDTALSLL